jgi:hypothetical protein
MIVLIAIPFLLMGGALVALPMVPATIVGTAVLGGYYFFKKTQEEKEEEAKTPLRQSLLLNPSTWIMGSILLAAIGLLIWYLNPALFAEAAVTMGIMQMVLASLATLTLVGGLLYTGYRAFSAKFLADDGDGKSSTFAERFAEDNLLTLYFRERLAALSTNFKTSVLLWGVGGALFFVVLGFTISYFTGGMPPEFFGNLLNFMGQAFVTTVHALASLPGLEFLSGASDVTLLFIGQIFSAIMLNLSVIFITDNVSRAMESTVVKFGIGAESHEACDIGKPEKGSGGSVIANGDLEERGCYDAIFQLFSNPIDESAIMEDYDKYEKSKGL